MARSSNLESAISEWKERGKRFEKLFDPKVLGHRDFQRENLKYLDSLRVKVKAGVMKDDTNASQALRIERNRIARKLYPNLIVRILESLLSSRRIEKLASTLNNRLDHNMNAIGEGLDKAGLSQFKRQVEQQMKHGSNEISIPVSYQVSETETMKVHIHMVKDHTGLYTLDEAKALLFTEGNKQPVQHTFKMDRENNFQAESAYNLLAGRAIFSDETNSWKRLDFNDRDAGGNFKEKHIPERYGFDIEKAVTELPIAESDKQGLADKLRVGDLVLIAVKQNKETISYKLAADPVKREIAVYDRDGSRISKDELKQASEPQKSHTQVKQLTPKNSIEPKSQVKARAIKI